MLTKFKFLEAVVQEAGTLLVLQSTMSILIKTNQVEAHVDDMSDALTQLTINHAQRLDLTATVVDPFDTSAPSPLSPPRYTCSQRPSRSSTIRAQAEPLLSDLHLARRGAAGVAV